MKNFFEKVRGGIYHGIGIILVILLSGIAYGAYVSMSDVTTGQSLTASTFNQVLENIRVLKATVDGIGSGTNPTGAVMAFNLSSCPSGWIVADGTAGTPDLRGTFIRGMNGSVNSRDVSRTLGSYQVDDFKSHNHYSGLPINSSHYAYTRFGVTTGLTGLSLALSDAETAGGSDNSNNGVNTSNSGGTETRSKNVALLYCVKQ